MENYVKPEVEVVEVQVEVGYALSYSEDEVDPNATAL